MLGLVRDRGIQWENPSERSEGFQSHIVSIQLAGDAVRTYSYLVCNQPITYSYLGRVTGWLHARMQPHS